ncbi:MAG TPA: PaaI family thioesterase, partial [Candidatus Acidoferrales bacterium]|nr:PaaI family thioesterase [Candidatus Acidoferrales bacterium]
GRVKLEPNPENGCFGCGGANQEGMKLAFEQDDERKRIVGRFRIGERYQGGRGFLHGGIIATLLDEAMGKVSRFNKVRAVTAELTVEFKSPVRVNEEIIVEGWQADRNGRSFFYEAEVRNAAGDVLARGRGRFVEIDAEKFSKKLRGQKV